MKKSIVILGAIVIEIVIAITLIPQTDHQHIETTDFANFYAAATIVRQGHGGELYRAETQGPVLKSILGHEAKEYFLHPPFEAAALVPFSYLSVEHAFLIWTLLNVACLSLLPLLLMGFISFVAQRPYLGLLGFAFPPALIALTLGQDSIMILFVMSAAYYLYSKDRDLWGGIALSLATVKFQYVLILALLLLFSRKWRLVAGFAAGCIFLGLISLMVTRPSGLVEYFRFLHNFDLHGGHGSLHPDRMVNLRGFLSGTRLVRDVRLCSMIGSVVLIAGGILCSRWATNADNRKLVFALYVAIAVAASPYAFFQDATILLLPIFLAMDCVLGKETTGVAEKMIIVCCVSLFLWPVILLMFGGHHVWDSRTYLMFLAIFILIATLMVELYLRREAHPAAIPT